LEKLKTVIFNYDHKETKLNKENLYEFSFNPKVKALKQDFELSSHLIKDFERSFFNGFTNEECFLIGCSVGRGLLTLEDEK